MTQTLDQPVADLIVVEQHQPDVPLVCSRAAIGCGQRALWEGLCMGCGHVVRRCAAHYAENARKAIWNGGLSHLCLYCETVFYLDQYARINA